MNHQIPNNNIDKPEMNNYKNTDWSMMDELIIESPKSFQQDKKPTRKDFLLEGDRCDLYFYSDMVSWYEDWNYYINKFINKVSIFFGNEFNEHRSEYFRFYRTEYNLLIKQFKNNEKNVLKYQTLHTKEVKNKYH